MAVDELTAVLNRENIILKAQLDDARKILRMIAEMPASTHSADAALCKEWLEENPPIRPAHPHSAGR